MNNSFYDSDELQSIGFGTLGENVLISRKASLYNPSQIFLGSNIRIDDFCIVTARAPVRIGSYTHLSAYSAIHGAAGFHGGDFVTISGRVAIYTESDDYSGRSLTNPMCPEELKPHYQSAPVTMKKYSIIGTCSTVLPGVVLEEGAAVAAHSLVREQCPEWTIVGGVPAVPLKARARDMKAIAENYYRR